MKNYFPFRLGTTSYVLNASLLTNIAFLKDKVDHIELLVFESETDSNYPSKTLVHELNSIADANDITYSVHLPLDVKLANPDKLERQADIAKTLRAIDATQAINPLCWDLHLEQNYKGEIPGTNWQEACVESLEHLKKSGVDPKRIGIENLEFDYKPIVPILDETGFAATLDIGHIWVNGLDETFYLEEILPRAISFHIHGYVGQQDHKGLHTIEPHRVKKFIQPLSSLPNTARLPVSIEVFSRDCFENSIQTLNTAFEQLFR